MSDPDEAPGREAMMERVKLLFAVLVGMALGALLFSLNGLIAGEAPQAPKYPLDAQLANEPAPWSLKGRWGERGNWGRWGEEDKRGMLNYITPEMIVNAAKLVKQGKVYPLGEEIYSDV